jgi:hypothetical protein
MTYLRIKAQLILNPRTAMDDKKIAALAKKNAAKAAGSTGRKGFGKKYDPNLKDLPTDAATLKERQEHERFFKEMRKRDF